MGVFLGIQYNVRQRREHDLTSLPLSGRVIGSVWQPTFICLQCNHREMPGKCFNLPILIQNARTLNQASQSKYSSHFIGLASAVGLHSTLALFLRLKHFGADPTQQHALQKYAAIPLDQGSVKCFVKYLLHEKHTPAATSVFSSKKPNPRSRRGLWRTERCLDMTTCDCEAGCYCITLPG